MVLWGYRQDRRDEINIDAVRSDKNKLYINVCLDPIETPYDPEEEARENRR